MIPIQEVQMAPIQEITQVQVPATHTRVVSSAIGAAEAPQKYEEGVLEFYWIFLNGNNLKNYY